MLAYLSKQLSRLPLSTIHRFGSALGCLMHWLSPASAKIQANNLSQSKLVSLDNINNTLDANLRETGKGLLETLVVWQLPENELIRLVKSVHHWHLIDEAIAQNQGIIFLTPHLGCFEITSIYYGSKHPITVLYRPPKLKFLHKLIEQGRQRTGVTLAEANASGVRKLMQALKRGEAIGILPDQIPAEGEGEWAPFFGKPAYTMTLASKLAEKTGASIIMAFGERLPNGQGYDIHLSKVDSIATTTMLNQAIERQIAQKPEQYLWQYGRYKVRRHAKQKLNAPID